MVEIVLHRVPGAKIEAERKPRGLVSVFGPLFDAIPEVGITPEVLFDAVMKAADEDVVQLLPRQFFFALVGLLDGGFISVSVRKVATA